MADELQSERPWEQQPGEPIKWFQRFGLFLESGPERTLVETYRQFLQSGSDKKQQARRRKKAEKGGSFKPLKLPAAWDAMVVRWRWRERADAFDRHMAEKHRGDAERQYELKLAAHQERSLAMAKSGQLIAERLLKAVDVLTRSANPKHLEKSAASLSSLIRASFHLGQLGINAEGHALGVESLIRSLQTNEESAAGFGGE